MILSGSLNICRGFLLASLISGAVPATMAGAETFETASEAVSNMKVGWNLGNTLDSNSGDVENMWIEHWTGRTPSDYEKAWGQPVTTPELLKMFKEAGFNAIRVPVTWYPHMEAKFDFNTWVNGKWDPATDDIGTKIQREWMDRVHEVVDYVIDAGMYCILNVHHDTGAASTAWLVADASTYAAQHKRFEEVWRQIAEEFKDYDEHLLFEGYNEMLDEKRSWCFASFASEGNYNQAMATEAYDAINSYAQTFVNAVRATGGNNAQRNLVVCTYGACDGSGNWNSHLKDPLKNMKLPDDKAENHIIFEVHSYPGDKTFANGKNTVNELVKNWTTHLTSKGAPMIVGEWGTDMTLQEDNCAFARYFIEQTKARGIATFHWMGLSDGESRSVPEFNEPELVDAMIKGFYGEGGYTGGIDNVDADTGNELVDVYHPSGVEVLHSVPRSQAESLLPSGLYIINGEKIIR